MNRRAFLSRVALGAGSIGGLAGCLGAEPPRAGRGGPAANDADDGGPPASVEAVELPVPRWDLDLQLPRDAIAAITEPRFADDWSDVGPATAAGGSPTRLADDVPVIGVERGGEARAYPLPVLDGHEIVNDVFEPRSTAGRTASDGGAGGPLLVTYCPLCGSGVVAERTVAGEPTVFGVSGYLWRSDLVMYDRATDSLWSQLLATAIRGPATGETLTLVPSSLVTWGAWREAYPGTTVLLPPPLSGTIEGGARTYPLSFYTGYEPPDSGQIVGHGTAGGELSGYTLVIGVEANGVSRAYPLPRVEPEGVVNDAVGGLPVVVAVAPGGTLVAYERVVDGGILRFRPAPGTYVRAGGSRWQLTSGRAVDGPYAGSRLSPATDQSPMFWRAWKAFHPSTTVYGDAA